MEKLETNSATFNIEIGAIYMAEEDLRHVGTCSCYTHESYQKSGDSIKTVDHKHTLNRKTSSSVQ